MPNRGCAGHKFRDPCPLERALRLAQNTIPNSRVEPLAGHYIDISPEWLLEEVPCPGHIDQTESRARDEIDQYVDIATGPRGSARHGTKQGRRLNPTFAQRSLERLFNLFQLSK